MHLTRKETQKGVTFLAHAVYTVLRAVIIYILMM